MQGQFTSPPPSEFFSSVDVLLQQFGVVMLVLLIAAAIAGGPRGGRSRSGRFRWKPHIVRTPSANAASPVRSSKISALERAMTRNFTAKKLFNKSEARIFQLLKEEICAYDAPLHVMGQVALREMVATDDKYVEAGGWHALSDRRVDFAIVDNAGSIFAAIEFHGLGHYQDDAERRDETKRLILEKAGIPLLVVRHGETPLALKNRLAAILASCGVERSAAVAKGVATQ